MTNQVYSFSSDGDSGEHYTSSQSSYHSIGEAYSSLSEENQPDENHNGHQTYFGDGDVVINGIALSPEEAQDLVLSGYLDDEDTYEKKSLIEQSSEETEDYELDELDEYEDDEFDSEQNLSISEDSSLFVSEIHEGLGSAGYDNIVDSVSKALQSADGNLSEEATDQLVELFDLNFEDDADEQVYEAVQEVVTETSKSITNHCASNLNMYGMVQESFSTWLTNTGKLDDVIKEASRGLTTTIDANALKFFKEAQAGAHGRDLEAYIRETYRL